MKTHYADVERGNESNPQDEWGTTACGLECYESPVTNKYQYVTCKNCIRALMKFVGDFQNQKEDNEHPIF